MYNNGEQGRRTILKSIFIKCFQRTHITKKIGSVFVFQLSFIICGPPTSCDVINKQLHRWKMESINSNNVILIDEIVFATNFTSIMWRISDWIYASISLHGIFCSHMKTSYMKTRITWLCRRAQVFPFWRRDSWRHNRFIFAGPILTFPICCLILKALLCTLGPLSKNILEHTFCGDVEVVWYLAAGGDLQFRSQNGLSST